MSDVLTALESRFGHSSFRVGQDDLVRAVMDGCDVLAVMPTGAGKSLGTSSRPCSCQGRRSSCRRSSR